MLVIHSTGRLHRVEEYPCPQMDIAVVVTVRMDSVSKGDKEENNEGNYNKLIRV